MNTSAQGQPQTGKTPASEPIQQQIISNPFPTETTSHNVDTSAGPAATPQAPADAGQPASTTPLLAADNDLIEKDWVSLVEKTIDELSSDPYQLQARQAQLSQEYLKKRFNLDVGQS